MALGLFVGDSNIDYFIQKHDIKYPSTLIFQQEKKMTFIRYLGEIYFLFHKDIKLFLLLTKELI